MRGNPEKTIPYRWKKGQSGNPKGRPPKRPISEEYEHFCSLPMPEDVRRPLRLPEGATYRMAVALATFRQAIRGKHEAAREIREAIEGKATVRIEHSGKDVGTVKLEAKLGDAGLVDALLKIYGLSPRVGDQKPT